ncbi:ABC transporter ATP-binding protein [Marinobacter sp. VGCF2001]|uniref:ABC transporter ATP-binding protein n=1 Tax=Marinobacter sp. VGCF2001 TaxID=3417189 RepID=UPI003CF7E529
MANDLIHVTGLAKTFESGDQTVSVLSGLDLSLAGGQSLALTGPSGSGKSTLLNILCGLERPDSGHLHVAGQTLAGEGAPVNKALEQAWAGLRRQCIGVVFQDANLMPALSLLDNIRLRASLAGNAGDSGQQWLSKLGIGELGERYPDQVSGGQRQRAALAMVFAVRPALILADEPTGSLDRVTAEAVADELFGLQARQGCGLILATHDPELAARCQFQLDLGHRGGA